MNQAIGYWVSGACDRAKNTIREETSAQENGQESVPTWSPAEREADTKVEGVRRLQCPGQLRGTRWNCYRCVRTQIVCGCNEL